MPAGSAAASDQALVSRWRRDYRLSVAILVAGIVMIVAISALSLWINSPGNYLSPFWSGLAVRVLGTAGGMLLLVGGIFTFHNWSLLQQSRRIT